MSTCSQHVCKILVYHKLPYTFVQLPLIQELLEIAHSAPSNDDFKLPFNDTIVRKVLWCILVLFKLVFNQGPYVFDYIEVQGIHWPVQNRDMRLAEKI
ncbi:hypothetical protein BGZ76_002465 [Entomortierella beljakovae]|nr:hypothetical protein BGZ76_002465 [Entomortierella beljakovae]